jgi:hypothetical protein
MANYALGTNTFDVSLHSLSGVGILSETQTRALQTRARGLRLCRPDSDSAVQTRTDGADVAVSS